MITIKLKGGLGNQMFQYACGRALSVRSGRTLYLDISNYERPHPEETPRPYTLHHFNIVGEISRPETTAGLKKFLQVAGNVSKKAWRKAFKKYNIGFNQTTFDQINRRAERTGKIVLDGFWWSEKYFADATEVIREDLTLAQPLGDIARVAENGIRNVKSTGKRTISIHIRRGDYVLNPETNAYHGTCSNTYYETALKKIEEIGGAEPTHLFVFSDDIRWVKENMLFPHPTTHVSEPGIEDYEEMILMSQCANHIIANSSFSWWAAWLNPKPDKIVVAPLQWTVAETDDLNEIIPNSWVRV
jgi:hypothetical protein